MPLRKYADILEENKRNNEMLIAENELIDAFDQLDEGVLMDIKKMGFFKGLKLAGLKALRGITDWVKNNPELQKSIKNVLSKGGAEINKDLTKILGGAQENLNTKLKEQGDKYAERIKNLEDELENARG